MKHLLIFVMALFIAISCSEKIENESIISDAPESNTLRFRSHMEFELITNKIPTMTEEELDALEREHSFLSYRSVLKKAYQEWESVDSDDAQQAFLERYKDILTLNDDELTPSISIPLYQAIVNREGVYQTGDYLNKVVGEFIVTTKKRDAGKLKMIKAISNNRASYEKDSVSVVRFMGMDEKAARTNAACTTEMSATYFHNESNCRNDRRVTVYAKSYITLSRTTQGDWRQPRVVVAINGTKRQGTWCKWYSYYTTLERRFVSFTINAWKVTNFVGTVTPFTMVLPDTAPTNELLEIKWDQPIGDPLLNQNVSPYPFTNFYGEGTSRGVDGGWAVLSCE